LKKEEEVQKSVNETTALLREALDDFRRCFQDYTKSMSEELLKVTSEIAHDHTITSAKKDELTAVVGSLNECVTVMKRHISHIQRGMKVVQHKNEVHANDRLVAALERMKRTTRDFQENMERLAKKGGRVGSIARQ
jgi:hypothetical protein